MEVWSDRGSTCKFRNARSAFRNLHVDPLSLHTSMRNKQVEFNPYIYTLSKLYRFGYEISVFNTKHPVIILRASLFVVTPSHVASLQIECQNFSYAYRSRKHLECKYYYLRVCTKLQVLSKTASRLWFYAYKKYKNGKSARRTYLQRHIRPSITQNGSDNINSGISENLPKIATSNVIFSRTADRIAAKVCMTIQKIKPNDIFQNCSHFTSTLNVWNRNIFKVSGATARWPFTDSAVPSLLLLLLFFFFLFF